VSVTDVPVNEGLVASLLAQVATEVAKRMATRRKMTAKNHPDGENSMKDAQKGTMKWVPFMSSFVLAKICALIKSSVRIYMGFKEVHRTVVAKSLMEHYCANVGSILLYNHLKKWRVRWLVVSRLCDLSGAQWLV
jgi:hypothetical protein